MHSVSARKMEPECLLHSCRDSFMQLRESAATGLMPVGVNFHSRKSSSHKGSRAGTARSSSSPWLLKTTKLRASLVDGSSIGADAAGVPGGVRDYRVFSSMIADSTETMLPSYQKVYEVVLKQAALVEQMEKPSASAAAAAAVIPAPRTNLLDEAYTRCGEICAEYAKTFYLGTLLMTPQRRKAIWAIYVWCRRTDELVDGPNASHITPMALDRWEQRLEDLFAGKPFDMLDGALADTVSKYPVDIQPFRDMIEGMRLDLVKSRYANFDELYLYCYYVAGTVGLMSVPVMGISADSKATPESVYNAGLALGIANQLTNILRDVGEDAARGRIYLPQDELARFGLTEEDIFAGKVTDKWRAFMKDQIRRARMFFKQAEAGVLELDKDSRWPVWASLSLYQQILDSIEANDYDNFKKRAYVNKWKKLAMLPMAYVRAIAPPKLSMTVAAPSS